MKRPTSVTVVCWILILIGIFDMIPFLTGSLADPNVIAAMSKSPTPPRMQILMLYTAFGMLVAMGTGIAMLYQQNWARLLYVGWNSVGSVLGLATSPVPLRMIPGILMFVIYAYFLFTPKANEYFAGTTAPKP